MSVPTEMLSVHQKKTTPLDLYRPLRQFIASHYSERDAVDLEDDLGSVQQMRKELEHAYDSLEVRRDTLQRYFRALCAMEFRFPISSEKDHVNSVSFTWHDAIKTGKKASQRSIHFEKAAVLFNLGAVQSQIAASADRSSSGGLKQACNSFMDAAGAFAFLRENLSAKASVNPSTVDISADSAHMLELLMMAQAQECFFEKAIADQKPPGICAKIARQTAVYYNEASVLLSRPFLAQYYDRNWITTITWKAAQHDSEAGYRTAVELHEKEQIGEEIARLKEASSVLVVTKKSSRISPGPLLDAISKLESNINLNLDRAMRENNRVYLLRIPPVELLLTLPGVSLVKPTNLVDVLDASKEKMFASIIPDSCAKALSKYTGMVDDIIRNIAEKLQQESEITRVKLKEMNLPDSLHSLEGNPNIPEHLRDEVQAIQLDGGLPGLQAGMKQLSDLHSVCEELLVQVEDILQKEATEDGQFRAQFGTRWVRPQSSTLTKSFQDRMTSFAVKLKQATEMDAKIERSVKDNSSLMSILEVKPIESALPSLARPIMSLNGDEESIVGSLKQSLGQLESLGAERAGLEDMLKEMKQKDNILPKLMTMSAYYEEQLFKKELAKYDPIAQEAGKNVEAQGRLLQQIKIQNADFAAVFNLEDYKASFDRALNHISAAVAKYHEIRGNMNNEGIKFYLSLQDAINNLKQQCSDYAMTRKMQCRELMEDLQRCLAGFTLQGNGSTNYPSPYTSTQHSQRPTAPAVASAALTPFPSQRPAVNAPSPNPYPQYYHHNQYRAPELSASLSMQQSQLQQHSASLSMQQSQPQQHSASLLMQQSRPQQHSASLSMQQLQKQQHMPTPPNGSYSGDYLQYYNPPLQSHQSTSAYYSQGNAPRAPMPNPDYSQAPYPGWQGPYHSNAPPLNTQTVSQNPLPPYHASSQPNYYLTPSSQGDFRQ